MLIFWLRRLTKAAGVPLDSGSGARCCIACDLACRPTAEGNLGVKDLAIQNTCLLPKFSDAAEPDTTGWRSETSYLRQLLHDLI
jgi:hypothetical protein